jgi:hypothetical protein
LYHSSPQSKTAGKTAISNNDTYFTMGFSFAAKTRTQFQNTTEKYTDLITPETENN